MTQHPEEGTLHAYIDGELSAAEVAALELHVGECAACAAALAEARGLVAAASRVVSTLDAAPSSAAKPVAPVGAGAATAAGRGARPPIFRVPYARAAALLLLVGGTAFVVDRTGMLVRGESGPAESLAADVATGSDLAATAPGAGAATAPAGPAAAPEASAAVAERLTGTGSAATAPRRAPVAPRPLAMGAIGDGGRRELTAERSARASETEAPATAQGGVARGVTTQDAVTSAEPPKVASTAAAAAAPKPAAVHAVPAPPARRDIMLRGATPGAQNTAPVIVRYRTKDGVVVTLTEEPLRASFAEESAVKQQPTPPPAERTAAAAMAAPLINSYRWSSAESGKTYTLSGPLTVAELEALSKRLSELERLP